MRSNKRPRIAFQDAVLGAAVISAVAIAPVDFSTVGLNRAGGVDIGRWLVLIPSLVAGPYVLIASPGTRRLIRQGPSLLFGVWLLWVWLGFPFGADPKLTLIAALTVTSLWLGVAWFVFRFGIRAFGAASVGSLALVALVGMGEDAITGLTNSRMDGISFSTNDLAILSSVGLVWAIILHRLTGNRAWLYVLPVFIVPLIGSGARMATVGTTMIVLVLAGKTRASRMALVAIVLVGGVALAGSSVGERFNRDAGTGTLQTSATTLNGRANLWANVPGLVEERPILGHGFKSGNTVWHGSFLAGDVPIDTGHSHNLVLELTVSTGIVGVNLFLASVIATVIGLVSNRLKSVAVIVALLLVLGLTEAVIEGPTVGLIQFIALGAAASAAAAGLDRDQPTSPPEPAARSKAPLASASFGPAR